MAEDVKIFIRESFLMVFIFYFIYLFIYLFFFFFGFGFFFVKKQVYLELENRFELNDVKLVNL